jgi:hypothetical protein
MARDLTYPAPGHGRKVNPKFGAVRSADIR